MTTEFENAILGQIDYINRMIEQHQKQIERKKIEIKSNELAIENYSNMKKLFEAQLEGIEKQAEKEEKKEEKKEKAEVKAPVKERATRFKTAHIGCFDEKGNQLGIWITQKAAAKALFMTPSNVCQIMKKDKEHQLKKRGYYLAWVY